jgi:cytochrome P450
VVRIGPNHLSFTDPRAWKDIYGHRTGGEKEGQHRLEMSKARPVAAPIEDLPTIITNAGKEEHQRLRRALSHGFSDNAIRSQEPLIMKHVDKLIAGLKDRCSEAKPLNMEAWYNWTTFDVVGDLVFGLSFGCLEKYEYNPWVHFMMESIKYGASMSALVYVGWSAFVQLFFRLVGSKGMEELHKHTNHMVASRLNLTHEREDLFEGIVKKKDEWVSINLA